MMLTVIALLGIAVVMVHSAGASVGSDAALSLGSMLSSRHAIYAVMAAAAMMLAARVGGDRLEHMRGWRNPLWWLFALAVLLVALAMVPGLGRSVHGARRWLQVGPVAWGGVISAQRTGQMDHGGLAGMVVLAAACGGGWRR